LFVFAVGASPIVDVTSVAAQSAPPQEQSAATPLPSVTVDAPKPRPQSQTKPRLRRAGGPARHAARTATPTHAAQTPPPPHDTVASRGTFQQGNGPIQGYVVHRSLVGTKTNTSILETPQAISVVGRDQIRDQNAQTIVQALGYTAGVATNGSPSFGPAWRRTL